MKLKVDLKTRQKKQARHKVCTIEQAQRDKTGATGQTQGCKLCANGQAVLLSVILILTMALLIVLTVSFLILNKKKISRNLLNSAQAYFVAEAGIEDSAYRIIKGKKYEPTNLLTIAGNRAEINITDEGGDKVILSKGIVSQRIRKIKTRLSIGTTNISFRYGAQVDRGGLVIQPNATIDGNVYSNGSITGAGVNSNSLITGDAWVAGGTEDVPNQEWTTQNADFSFGRRVGSIDFLDAAQSFIPSQSKLLNKVSLYLKKVGNPPDQTIRIVSDNGGKPSRNSLASGILSSSKVTANYSWVDVSLATPLNLTAGQTYWIIVDVSRDDANYWVWGRDSTNDYVSGTGKYTDDWSKNNAVWKDVGGDLNFKIWLAGIATEINGVKINVDAHANRILNSKIGRDAYYQYIYNTDVDRYYHSDSADPPVEDMPISYAQIQDWEKAAAAGGEISGPYSPPNGSSLGPVKITGDLIFIHDTIVTITGPIWAAGNITAENNVTIKLPDDLTSGYAIIADSPADQANAGKIVLTNNVITQDSPLGGILLLISTNKSMEPTSPAVDISNNINFTKAQSAIYSLQGLIRVFNNAKFKEITGYALYLANNAKIIYDVGLINASFSSGPGAGWRVVNWQEVE